MTETELRVHKGKLIELQSIQLNEMAYYDNRADKEVNQQWKDGFKEQAKMHKGYANALDCAIDLITKKIDEVTE